MDKKQILSEIMHDDMNLNRHNLSKQTELHEKIRNDEDYDDWDYGTEPNYGKRVIWSPINIKRLIHKRWQLATFQDILRILTYPSSVIQWLVIFLR